MSAYVLKDENLDAILTGCKANFKALNLTFLAIKKQSGGYKMELSKLELALAAMREFFDENITELNKDRESMMALVRTRDVMSNFINSQKVS